MDSLLDSLSVAGTRQLRVSDGEGEDVSLPKHTQLAVYRIVQEALNNIEKHAAASSVEIELIKGQHVLMVLVHDDGRGMHSQPISPKSYGLTTMRDRARSFGGQIHWEVSGRFKKGTVVSIQVPLID